MGFLDGAGSGLISGGISAIGGMISNAQNRREAERNRGFQAYMSNTSHQREVEDLEKAGLNPLLSARNGASTPSGAQASMENIGSAAATSAMEGIRLKKDIEQAAENIELTKAQKAKTNMEAALIGKEIPKASFYEMLWNKANKMGSKIETNAKKVDNTLMHQPSKTRTEQIMKEYINNSDNFRGIGR